MANDSTGAEGRFPSTNWSQVSWAAAEKPGAWLITESLLLQYLPAMKAHLIFTRKRRPEDVEDLIQGFITDKLLGQRLLSGADRGKGKFRTYLLTALDHYVVSDHRRQSAAARHPGCGKLVALEAWHDCSDSGAPAAGDGFHAAWARQVIAETVARMRLSCDQTARPDIWRIFETRILGPILYGEPTVNYEDLVAQLGLKSLLQASNLLTTAKRMFSRCLREVVGEYVTDEREIEPEIADLYAALAGGRA